MDRQHSGLGIASFILSLLAGFFLFLTFAAAGALEASTPGGMDEESKEAMMLGLALFLFLGFALVALGLGLAGLFQYNRNKLFAILGIVFSGLTVLGTVALLLVGMAMS